MPDDNIIPFPVRPVARLRAVPTHPAAWVFPRHPIRGPARGASGPDEYLEEWQKVAREEGEGDDDGPQAA